MAEAKFYIDWSRLSRQKYNSGIQVIARHISEVQEPKIQVERIILNNGYAFTFTNSSVQKISSSLTLFGRRYGSRVRYLGRVLAPATRRALNSISRIPLKRSSRIAITQNSLLFVVDTVLDNKSLNNILELKLKYDLKLIVLVHDLLLFTNVNELVWNKSAESNTYFELMKNAETLVVASETLKTQLLKVLGESYKNRVLVIGFPSTRKFLNSKHGVNFIKKENDFILAINKFDVRKNWDLVLDVWISAYDKSLDFKLVCVGATGDNLSKIRKRVKQLQKLNYPIEMYVDLGESEKIGLLDSASLFLVCSTEEGYGLPLVEALQAGCLCLVPEIDVYREHMANWNGITFYEPNNLLEASALLAKMTKNEFNDAQKKKTIKENLKLEWCDYLEEIVEFVNNKGPHE